MQKCKNNITNKNIVDKMVNTTKWMQETGKNTIKENTDYMGSISYIGQNKKIFQKVQLKVGYRIKTILNMIKIADSEENTVSKKQCTRCYPNVPKIEIST